MRLAREAKGLYQAELAQKANVCQATISRLENNNDANFFTIAEVARILGVSLDWIAYGDKNENCNARLYRVIG